jgi:hypothetical protein
MEEGTVYEDIIRLRARRLGAVALLLYAVGTLITVVGVAAGLAIILSSVPSGPSMPTTPEVVRAIAGVVLMAIGFIFYVYFALYAGFKGRGVVSRTDLSGWGVVVKNLGRLYFIATLLVAIGIIVIPGTSFLYSTAIIFLVSSALFMVSAYLAPSLQRSITAGIILIIASITTIVGVRAGIPGFLGQVPGISQITSLPLTYGLLSAIAFMIVGVALIVRGMALHRLIPDIIAGVGGMVYASGLAYTQFSIVSTLSELSSYLSWLQPLGFLLPRRITGPAEAGFWTLYSTSIAGSSLIGIAGIIGLIALILSIVFLVKSVLPATVVEKAPPQQPTEPRRLNYCPGCGSPVSPEDMYCGSCGRKLR